MQHVDWNQVLPQFPRFVGMLLVVAFSSSLDVAAIEMELGLPLDYDRELQTVGMSNLLSGCCGGFTGSYIFSQTIFNLRRGVTDDSRVCGWTVAVLELLVVVSPVSVTSYLPKMFFGSLLVLIATDLMWEWLLMARKKMLGAEYLVCLGTFLAIHATGIEVGMVVGVLLAMVCFVVAYAQATSQTASSSGGGGGLSLVPKSSTVVRSYEERSLLIAKANRGRMVTIQLKGYIFFGSAVKILEEVKRHLNLNTDMNVTDDGDGHKASSSLPSDQADSTPTRKEEDEAWRGRRLGGSPQYMHETSLPQHHMFCMTMAAAGTDHHFPPSSATATASGGKRKTSFLSTSNNSNNNSNNSHSHISSSVTYPNGDTGVGGYASISMQGDDFESNNNNHNDNNNNDNGLLHKALQSLLIPRKLISSSSAAASLPSTAPIPIQTTTAIAGGGAPMPSVYSMSGDEVG